jgi:glycopeptide antibiotics resistance protein
LSFGVVGEGDKISFMRKWMLIIISALKRKYFFLVIYLIAVMWYTVLHRSIQYSTAQLEFFWSYKAWFAGDTNLGKEILANIAMFFPFGFLLSSVHRRPLIIILCAVAFSLTIETLQLVLMRGLFEWDDVVSNTIGAGGGILLFLLIDKIPAEKHKRIITTTISSVFMLTCLVVIARGHGTVEADSTSRAYCFQVDNLSSSDGVLTIDGFCLRYEHPDSDYCGQPKQRIFLKSVLTTTGCGTTSVAILRTMRYREISANIGL